MPTLTDALAQAGVEGIASGMIVGLGTGRAASRAIDALARRVSAESLAIRCVATSRRSESHARELGLRVDPLESVDQIDWLFDGADEVDPQLRLLKGAGGAMTREKIVAQATARRVYLVQQQKLVERLGSTCPLPIEVLSIAGATVLKRLESLGLAPVLRADGSGRPIVTDNAGHIFDAPIPPAVELEGLARALDAIPGVLGHGLFLSEADLVIIEDRSGAVRRLERAR